jgi:hypothetical protein
MTGCIPSAIKLVDEQGNPISGALVVTEQSVYIMQPWKLDAHFSDAKGEVKIATDSGSVFSESYHPLINAHLNRVTTLYKVDKETLNIKQKSFFVPYEMGKKLYAVPLSVCQNVQVKLIPHESKFVVSSQGNTLIESQNFYFKKGEMGKKVSSLTSTYPMLSFYCQSPKGFSKVGLKLNTITHQPVPKWSVDIKEIKGVSLSTIIKPKVRTAEKDSFYMIRELTPESKPKVSTSPNIKERLKGFNDKIVGGNIYTQELFDYVLQADALSKE